MRVPALPARRAGVRSISGCFTEGAEANRLSLLHSLGNTPGRTRNRLLTLSSTVSQSMTTTHGETGMPPARRGKRWLVMPALIATAGLGAITPAQATARTATVTTAYVASYDSGTITPIDAATDTAGTPIQRHRPALALAATPDGNTLYVASIDNRPAPAQYYVTPINTATGKPGTPIPNAWGPLAMSPDGKTLYAIGDDGLRGHQHGHEHRQGQDPAHRERPCHHHLPGRPEGIRRPASRPFSSQGSVTGINLVTGRLVRTICRRGSGAALAVTPDSSTVYAAGDGISPSPRPRMTAGTPIRAAGGGFAAMQVSADGKTL